MPRIGSSLFPSLNRLYSTTASSLSNDLSEDSTSTSTPNSTKHDETDDLITAFDMDDTQEQPPDELSVRRTRMYQICKDPDGTTHISRTTFDGLSPDIKLFEEFEVDNHMGSQFNAKCDKMETSTSEVLQDNHYLTPNVSPQFMSPELKDPMSATEDEVDGQHHTIRRSSWNNLTSIVGLSFLNFMCGFSVTVDSVTAPVFSRYSNATTEAQPLWAPGSLLLIGCLFQPLMMRLSHVTGCKPLIVFGSILSIGTSGYSAFTHGHSVGLLTCHLVGGFELAIVRALTPLVVAQLMITKPFPWYETWPSLSFWLGASVGPIIGTLLSEHSTRQSIAWIEAATGIIGLALLLTLRLRPIELRTAATRIPKIDYVGWAILSVVVVVVAATAHAAIIISSWVHWQLWLSLFATFGSSAIWVYHAGHVSEPILPISIFRDRYALAACLGALAQNLLSTAIIYLLPIYLVVVRGLDMTNLGLHVSSFTLSLFVATSIVANRFRTQEATALAKSSARVYVPLMAFLGVSMGVVRAAQLIHSGLFALSVPYTALVGFGLGIVSPLLSAVVQMASSNDDETIHSLPLYNFFSSLGQLLGIVTVNALLIVQLGRNPPAMLDLSNQVSTVVARAVGSFSNFMIPAAG